MERVAAPRRAPSEGDTDLNAALSAWAGHLRGAGMSVVISDLFSPTGYQHGIDALLARRQDMLMIHVLAPDELHPPADLLGEWRLTDAEPAAPLEATITPGVLRAYRRLLQTFIAEARRLLSTPWHHLRAGLERYQRGQSRAADVSHAGSARVTLRVTPAGDTWGEIDRRTGGAEEGLMGFLTPGVFLLGAALVAAVLASYLLRPRRPVRRVSSTFLWLAALHDLESQRPWRRVPPSLLLLLQLRRWPP